MSDPREPWRTKNEDELKLFVQMREERDGLKAKLAEEEGRWEEQHAHQQWVNQQLAARAEKAEAEAAALRELLQVYADATGSYCWGQDDCDAIKAALSQPGPGAALLEEHRRLQETTQWQAERMKIAGIKNLELSERVKKLEAVAEAAGDRAFRRARFHPKEHPSLFPAHKRLMDAIAALEEKP